MKPLRSMLEHWEVWRHQKVKEKAERQYLRALARGPSLIERLRLRKLIFSSNRRLRMEERRFQREQFPSALGKARTKLRIWQRVRQEQAQVRKLNRILIASPSAFARAKQKFLIWRSLRHEQRLQADFNKSANDRPPPWNSIVAGFVFFALVGVYCWAATGQINPDSATLDNIYRTAVTINGKAISDAVLVETLRQTYGSTVLQKLTEQEVVRQEAKRLNIVLTNDELERLQRNVKDDPLQSVHLSELQTTLLLRKIALKDVGEERKRDIYRTFRNDLKLYTLVGYHFATREAAGNFEAAVANGMSLDRASKAFSTDGLLPIELGTYTLPMIDAQLGRAAMEALDGRGPQYRTRQLSAPTGTVIYRVLRVEDTFERVEPVIDDLIAEADSATVLFRLLGQAKIESPHLEPAAALLSSQETSRQDDIPTRAER